MKTNYFCRKPLFAFVIFILILSLADSAIAREEKKGEGSATKSQMTPEAQAMMAKWQEFATPGENHKVLNALVGNWDYAMKWWMAPESEPAMSKGTNEIKWILGGRFLQDWTKGTSMGQPFEGMGLTGFDNGKKKYQATWIDNMGTGILTSESTYDPVKKIFTEHGRFTDPTGEISFRGKIKLIDNDHYVYEMYTPGKDGKEFRMLEISYTRKK